MDHIYEAIVVLMLIMGALWMSFVPFHICNFIIRSFVRATRKTVHAFRD